MSRISLHQEPHKPDGFGKPRLLALLAGLLAMLVLVAACETADVPTPTPTQTPTPTPSPTPTPAPDPIVNLSTNATYADLAGLLPQEAVDCLVSALGQAAYDGLLTQEVFGDDINFNGDLPADCFPEDVVISIFVATLSQVAGTDLSDATVTCIRATFTGFGVDQLAELASGELGGDGVEDVFGVAVGLLLCLTDDEAERITAGGLFGDAGGLEAISLADIRCILETVGVAEIIALVGTIDGDGAPDLGTGLELLTALGDCGLSLDDLVGGAMTDDGATTGDGAPVDDTPQVLPGALGDIDLSTIDLRNIEGIPPELQVQITCVVDAMGEENLQGMVAGTYTPVLEDLIALGTCNLDLAQLGDLSAIIGG